MFLGEAELSASEKSYIQRFKTKAREFWLLWNNLGNQQSTVAQQSPEIQRDYADLMDRGSTIRSTIEYVTGAIDKASAAYSSVKNWLSSTFGLDGAQIDEQTNQMGIIPLIPIAVIVAGLAAMGKWIKDVYTFNGKLTEIKRLESQGIAPSDAAAIVERTMNNGFFGTGIDINTIIPIALLGVAAIMVFRKG